MRISGTLYGRLLLCKNYIAKSWLIYDINYKPTDFEGFKKIRPDKRKHSINTMLVEHIHCSFIFIYLSNHPFDNMYHKRLPILKSLADIYFESGVTCEFTWAMPDLQKYLCDGHGPTCDVQFDEWVLKSDSSFAPSQWQTVLLCNDFFHWLGANHEPALSSARNLRLEMNWLYCIIRSR